MADDMERQMTNFERFALDHTLHNHCQGCGGCLLDPSSVVQSYQAWCVGCRDRIKANCAKADCRVPWHAGFELSVDGTVSSVE